MSNQAKPQELSSTEDASASIKNWVVPETFCKLHPNIPEKTLNWQLTKRHRNGLDKHVQIIGKKRFISIKGYAAWLDKNQEASV